MSHHEDMSDDDYDFTVEQDTEKRYPLHDCCEFEDVQALRVRKQLIVYLCLLPRSWVVMKPKSWVLLIFLPLSLSVLRSFPVKLDLLTTVIESIF